MHPSAVHSMVFSEEGSEVAKLINLRDWEASSLGSKQAWPDRLVFTLDLMLQSAFPMFLFWGSDHVFFYNDAFQFALQKEGRHPMALGAPGKVVWADAWSSIEPLFHAVLEGQKSVLFEEQYLPLFSHDQNEENYWTFSYNPVRNDEGRVEGILAICHENTLKVKERKNSEHLREQLALAIEAWDLGTWELNPRTMQFKCNEKTKSIFGLAGSENIDLQTAIDVILPKDRSRVTAAITQALNYTSGGRYAIEYTIVQPQTRERRQVRVSGKASFDNKQWPEQLAGTIQDITEEKVASTRNEKLQQLVESSIDYMSMASLDGFITYINPSGRQLVGIDPEEDVTVLPIHCFYHDAQFTIIKNEVIPALHEKGQWSGFVKIKHQKTGEEIPCHGNYVLIKDQKTGQVLSRGLTLRDLRPDLQARKELEESEKRFRNLVQEAPVATAIYTGREMRIQWANDAMIRLWGKDTSVIGKTVREALPELEDQPFHGQLDEVFTTGKMYQATEDKGELVVDGKLQTFYFNFSYKPLHDSDGKVYGILNMAVDVTETVKNKQKLQESETAFRNLIMQAPVGICVLKGEDFFVDIVNDQYLHLVGRARADFEHRPLWEVLPEAREQGFDELLKQVKKTGTPYFGHEQAVDLVRNGQTETVYVNFVYEPLSAAGGAVHSILVIVIDISQQVRMRQLIENAEERARLAIVSGNMGTYEVNLMNDELIASQRFHELFDVAEKGIRSSYIARIYPDDLPVRQKAHELALENGVLHYECRIVRRDGTMNWVQIDGQVYYTPEQRPYKIIGIAQDITGRKNIEQELEKRVHERTSELLRLNEELQQFNFITSHDLKEPLRKIQVFGSLAQEYTDPANIKVVTGLDKVMQSAGRMSSLLQDLMQYTAVSNPKKTFTRVDLNKVLQHVLDDCELLIEEQGAQIFADSLPVLDGIEFQLTQLFYNLLHNALKFSKPGQSPVIHIRHSVLSDREKKAYALPEQPVFYKFVISDNGIGFQQEFAEKIFVVFQRLHDRAQYSGNGIGLALCKKIVENHSGKISVSSTINEGTVFTLLLPEKEIPV